LRYTECSATALAVGADLYSITAPKFKIRVTVIIPALNEAARIRTAVEPLNWADEVIVADGGSTDHTAELASEVGAKVIDARGGTIASQRNAAIAVARNCWILALDADERVPDQLRDEIAAVLEAPQHEAYRIRFRNFYLGREIHHGRWGNEYHVRLFRSGRRFQERSVHENLEPVSNVGSLRASIQHNPYHGLSHHLEKMARYARWGAEDLALRGRRTSYADLTFRPVWRFIREYIVYSGWRDARWTSSSRAERVLGSNEVRAPSGTGVANCDPDRSGRGAPTASAPPRGDAARSAAHILGLLSMAPPC
jgi:glycosyltransferase involved in cell wall biosynthesis